MKGNVIVGQSGGPTAAINSSLAGVYRTAKDRGANKVYGMLFGIQGLLQERYIDLSEYITNDLDTELLKRTPAAFLGSCRYKLPEIHENKDVYEKIFSILEKLDIEAFIYIGGNDSMDTIKKLSDHAIVTGYRTRFIGCPKTIDNDLALTDHTPGYGSAAKYIGTSVKEIIRDCFPLGPLHNPANLMGIEACEKAMPSKPQVAVFDTAFHMTMPPKAYRYAIPTKYYTEDHLRRYGFHGTSHRFVSKRCIELMGGVENAHRVIVCHLGNGSSLSAVKDGKCQDTSMGLSPLAGVPMGTRAGDIDTCVAQFIMNKYNMSADDCLTMLNKKSGVLALSDGVSSDFRDLDAAAEKGNEAAQLALDKFAYEVRKYIGAYAAALGGVDCIVFTAGVGENSGSMRASICDGLEYLGVKLDPEKNKLRGEEVVISTPDSKVTVWVIPTNEELMIAQDTAALTR